MRDDGTGGRPMGLAIFHREFNWSRPRSRFSFNARASAEPQSRVHDFIEAAVAAGAATRVYPTAAEAPTRRKRRSKPQ